MKSSMPADDVEQLHLGEPRRSRTLNAPRRLTLGHLIAEALDDLPCAISLLRNPLYGILHALLVPGSDQPSGSTQVIGLAVSGWFTSWANADTIWPRSVRRERCTSSA
jgi:hypothetical protein